MIYMGNMFQLDHVVLSPRQQIGLHQQSTWELSLVVKGEGERTMGDTTETFHAGDLVLVQPQMPHCWRFNDTNDVIENITILIEPALLHALFTNFPELKPLQEKYEEQAEAIFFAGKERHEIESILEQMEHQSQAMQLALLVQILVLMAESRSRQTAGRKTADMKSAQRLKNIQIFLNCNFQRQITIEDVARYVGMNRSAVCVFFRQQTGNTIMGSLTDIRLREAQHLLANTSQSIQEICYKCGFQDVPHFCRVFKQKLGMTAKNWRKGMFLGASCGNKTIKDLLK